MVSTYLIDFENVKSGGLAGIDCIQKEDSVHLFWSKRENKISIEMMERIRQSSSEIVMHQAVTGERDALDHQLCSYLGFLAGQKKETNFVIISNDKAYDHLIEFWKRFNSEISIHRVSEISKAIDAGKGQEAAAIFSLENRKEAAEGNVEKTEKVTAEKVELPATELENAYSEGRGVHNSRRRERGSKYLRSSRNGRNSGKDFYQETVRLEESMEMDAQQPPVQKQVEATEMKVPAMENPAEAFEKSTQAAETRVETKKTAEQPVEALERVEQPVTKPVKPVEQPIEKLVETTKTVVQTTEKPLKKENLVEQSKEAEKPAVSSAAFVVRGIRAGILVESGFTADGILEKRKAESEENEKPAAVNVEAAGKEKTRVEATEEFSGEKSGKTTKRRTPRKKNEKQIKNLIASSEVSMKLSADSSEVENPSEESAELEVQKTQKKASRKKETKVVREKLETTEKSMEQPKAAAEKAGKPVKKTEATVEKVEEPLKKTEATVEKAEETAKRTEIVVKKTKSTAKKTKTAVAKTQTTAMQLDMTAEKAEEPVKKTEATTEKAEEPVKKSETAAEKAEPAADKIEGTEERTENKKRARRGRPPKKQPLEVIPEMKKTVTASDVMEKCEDAAEEKWAEKVAAFINESRDKKELYAATVKLLGQEKGRTVYHTIKVLK